MTLTRSDIVAGGLALAAGISSWELVRHLGGRREAWDDPAYWTLGYPLLLGAAFGLGLVWRDRPWRWVAMLMGGQAAWSFVLALVDTGVPNLFPLGLIVFAVLALPCLCTAYVGKWIGERVLT